jgi:hypothetical protein
VAVAQMITAGLETPALARGEVDRDPGRLAAGDRA